MTMYHFPPISVKYVLLGMLSEDMSRPPRDHPQGWTEYFWPAEDAGSLATFMCRVCGEESPSPLVSPIGPW